MRKIIHVDMDCFYAAVEMRDRPELRGKPIGVGGGGGRGVLTTANYEARKFGVRSAMPTARALKLCPDLVLVPVNFVKYREASKKIREIFKRYTDKIQPLSLDEAYLDVTDSEHFGGSATKLAEQIRKDIWDEVQLPASAGIAENKFLAKVASDWNKPNGQFTIRPQDVEAFMKKLPVKLIPGVGKVTQKKMAEMGIHSCLDLQSLSEAELIQKFGSWGPGLARISRGIDERPVEVSGVRKSLSVENTYFKDLKSTEEAKQKVQDLFREFLKRWDRSQIPVDRIRGARLKLRFSDFSTTTYEKAMRKLPLESDFQKLLTEKLASTEFQPIRLLGIGVKLQGETKSRAKGPQLELSLD